MEVTVSRKLRDSSNSIDLLDVDGLLGPRCAFCASEVKSPEILKSGQFAPIVSAETPVQPVQDQDGNIIRRLTKKLKNGVSTCFRYS